MMMENLPALGKLIADVKRAAQRGYLVGLDGRHLHVRSDHAALNTLLQSAGALVMKQALVLLAQSSHYRRDFEFVANVHDEFQMEVRDDGDLPETVGLLAADCIKRAGEHFNFRCPLSGSYAVGGTWAETH